MKTKFTISTKTLVFNGAFKDETFNAGAFKQHYEEYYEENGWQIDEESIKIYMIVDNEINLKEGDRVNIVYFYLVDWKCVNVLEDMIEYALDEE